MNHQLTNAERHDLPKPARDRLSGEISRNRLARRHPDLFPVTVQSRPEQTPAVTGQDDRFYVRVGETYTEHASERARDLSVTAEQLAAANPGVQVRVMRKGASRAVLTYRVKK